MKPNTTALERAFSLAESGECASVKDISDKLRREGYDIQQLTGKSLVKQLRDLVRETQSSGT
ncbi:hypothetical protein EN812_31310 [Mesorhizobium sp. M4B.F.Ca.ET.169.01.1.1]|uniref:hypothetical protein n=1 Tax=unclassified Mesorhizobium TaxID=325217 RepID=UPI000FC9AF3B|nr:MULTISPECIES: hypothetical protein [unclassified Mesorhizobium]RUW21761.1 hypothetical protein EOA34_23450 [Mesorhizobium sp. M4B.F.Ca.ET.013.02.1.1]RVD41157.1 hypothetical protein EN741_15075 [Mesorhizobium sp. M4B.F.Ca.ET.019.03.1.1]RWF61076.1 MAG: hypothetical protein EOS47_29685 [Mesorhizobium sp.]TGQ27561.1 hypothetical protein EN857_32900 [Mesorhizobium sp. M4B.F.Ca.ET.214.01.1.1]TGQ54601.1 hypothetical protein EN854_32825 [Mesorhizobium sp. M4B.F.Ca.ET.211.01.1.1]